MRALDLCCKAGGASMGLRRSGLFRKEVGAVYFDDITGVDIKPQPRYPFTFLREDVTRLTVDYVRQFDFVWASPPCQRHTKMRTMHNAREHGCIIEPVRAVLKASGVPYAIENVVGAPLVDPVMLCMSAFTVLHQPWQLQRHRLVEASFPLEGIACAHWPGVPVLGVYGGHVRDRRRRAGSASRGVADPPREEAELLMDIDWMTLDELSEAIPPAYSRHVVEEWQRWRGAVVEDSS